MPESPLSLTSKSVPLLFTRHSMNVTLAKSLNSYAKADCFETGCRAIEVLIDQDTVLA